MERYKATTFLRAELDKYGLRNWKVRLNNDPNSGFLGLCSYKDKCIILNTHHVDIHPDAEVINTIRHEVAHALCPGQQHNEIWAAKAKEIGCDNTLPCSHLNLPEHVIDAIRSGANVEMEVTEETQVIRHVKHKISRIQDLCPKCGKEAKLKIESKIFVDEKTGDEFKLLTLECFHVIRKDIPKSTPFHTMVSNDWKDEVKNCKHEWPADENEAAKLEIKSNQCKKCHEFKLYDFQVAGAKLAELGCSVGKGFGIFDDMGLGKTVQALALVKFHKEYTPTLYVVKSAIKFNWFKEVFRWLGPSYMAQVINTGKDPILPGLKSYIIAYDLLRRMPKEELQKLNLNLIVMDECQQVKNPDSTRTQMLRNVIKMFPSVKVVPLSGTPWKNRGSEFFVALNMINPTKFYSYQNYLKTWVAYEFDGNKRKEGGIRNPARFKEYVSDMLVRREYEEVMKVFPTVNRMKLHVQLDSLSQNSYNEEVSSFVKWYNEALADNDYESEVNSMAILARLNRMRHIAGLAKIPATISFAEEFFENTDKKLAVFLHHKDVGHIIYSEFKKLFGDKIDVFSITAEHSDAERFEIQEAFNKSPRAFIVASTLASGEGINLQTCADAIMHERQWNPQNEDQAFPGRFRRIGQESKYVNGTFVEAEGTVDEHLDGIVERKRIQFHEVMNKGEAPVWNEGDIIREIAEAIISKHKIRKEKSGKETNLTGMTKY
jgi:hypothetical protein